MIDKPHIKSCIANRVEDYPRGISDKQLYSELNNYSFSQINFDECLDEMFMDGDLERINDRIVFKTSYGHVMDKIRFPDDFISL